MTRRYHASEQRKRLPTKNNSRDQRNDKAADSRTWLVTAFPGSIDLHNAPDLLMSVKAFTLLRWG